MLKKKGAPSFKPKAGIRRNAGSTAAKGQSATPAPAPTPASTDSTNAQVSAPIPASAEATSEAVKTSHPRAEPQVSHDIPTPQQPLATPQSPTVEPTVPAVSPPVPAQTPIRPSSQHDSEHHAGIAVIQPTDTVPQPTPLPTRSGSPFSVRADESHSGQQPSDAIGSTEDSLIDPAITGVLVSSRPAPGTPSSSTQNLAVESNAGDPQTQGAHSSQVGQHIVASEESQDTVLDGTSTGNTVHQASRKPKRKRPDIRGESGQTSGAEAGPSQTKKRPRTKSTVAASTTTDEAQAETATSRKRARRARSARSGGDTDTGAGEDAAEESGGGTKKRKSASKTPRKERSVTPEDAEERSIDPKSLTMAELTKDLRIGKKFSRHDELRDRMKALQEKQREERRLRKMNGGVASSEDAAAAVDGASTEGVGSAAPPSGGNGSGSGPTQAAALGPQFEIINGEIVINQASLVHDRHAAAMADQADMEEVEENDFTRMTNQATYLRPTKIRGPNTWTKEETAQFYEYLRMFGTDFQTIANMFPGRMRRHVKMKFNREEKHNAAAVNAALVGQKEVMINLDEYQTRTGKALEATADIEEEYRKRAEAHEAEQKRIQAEADAVQAEKRKKLLGLGTDGNDANETAKKDVPDGKLKGAAKTQTGMIEEEEDVEVIDEDEREVRPPPRRRGRVAGGIGG